MAEWAWEARARTGELRTGIMAADTADAVQSRLRAQNLNPTRVKKRGGGFQFPGMGVSVTEVELVIFIRQFATMIDAGLPLVQCLDILSSQGANKGFNGVLKDVKATVEQGATFSDALKRHPKIFDELFTNLVAAGEMGGILDTILNRLAIYIEKRVKLKRQVKGAMVYPASVMGVAVIIMGVLLTYVVPTFEAMFMDFGGKEGLPAMTKFVVGISHGFIDSLPLIIGGGTAAFFGISFSYQNPQGKRFWHWLELNLPALGGTMKKIAVARFTRTLGTLLSSGVPIIEALTIVAKSSGNVLIEDAIMKVAARISEGKTMAEPLGETGMFPSMVVQMIGVGEQTGAMDQMLNKIADFYEEEVDVAVAALASLMEPVMMVGIGGMVGFMMIAMYMPIFDIAGKVKAE